ncbi:gremlin-2-like [Mizuhopecten yessoensis]|uniref:Gremlin-1 n=1 Tax=Mizuhopecten yessoensis TaxID=6573 RepID=A0A210Q0Y3_MIZYE|nr:gremlin-2-like [Mizuhopecten yessoensis]XP_021370152.1 gremlin-2-like [Mizuhopecten yessoensis]OWF42387.1 Gremlin-1 [Mizuhopecten yessoensis]
MRLCYVQLKTTIIVGIVWLFLLDIEAMKQTRIRHRTSIDTGRRTADRRRGTMKAKTRTQAIPPFGTIPNPAKASRKELGAKVNDIIRPTRGKKNSFVITKRQHLKKEWCKTQHFTQVVREPGCLSRTIINNFCYGQCNSFFIPKSDRRDLKEAAFVSCGFCKPRAFSTIRVTLMCPGKHSRLKRKRILKIKKCRCMAQKVDMNV